MCFDLLIDLSIYLIYFVVVGWGWGGGVNISIFFVYTVSHHFLGRVAYSIIILSKYVYTLVFIMMFNKRLSYCVLICRDIIMWPWGRGYSSLNVLALVKTLPSVSLPIRDVLHTLDELPVTYIELVPEGLVFRYVSSLGPCF